MHIISCGDPLKFDKVFFFFFGLVYIEYVAFTMYNNTNYRLINKNKWASTWWVQKSLSYNSETRLAYQITNCKSQTYILPLKFNDKMHSYINIMSN